MEQRRYEFLLEAVRPVCHLAETIGNQGLIARRKVRLPDGEWAHVPIISGNQLRHKLREASAYCLLDALGLLDAQALLEPTIRLLFNGGELTKKGAGGGVNFESYRTLCEMVPPLALLGGCANGTINEGQGSVDYAILVCDESWHLLPKWVHEHFATVGARTDSARAHIEEIQNVRTDISPRAQKLLTEGEQVRRNRLLTEKSAAHDEGEETSKEGKSRMLPYTTETVVMGSVFYWSVAFNVYSELELDTLHTMISAWLRHPTVGGKSGSGHGELRIVTARNITVRRPSDPISVVEVDALAPKVGSLFYAHVQERQARIVEFLKGVEA